MEAARWNRIESLLQQALDLSPSDRGAFLDRMCGSDRALRREVELLLAREHEADFLSRAPFGAELREAPSLTGTTIGPYRIAQRIGKGGMGEVYEAYDERLLRVVALKALSGPLTTDPERVRRFEQEAFAASRLNHPNIVTIFEIVRAGDAHFIAAERIDGVTLREMLKERAIPVEKALDIAIQIAAALKAAHTSWIIHRDIKPENVMVRSDGLVKVLDFGIAKLAQESGPEPLPATVVADSPGKNLTVPGAVLGTANYMSPEQSRGEDLDGRSDLYSFGLVLLEMLKGEHAKVPKVLQPVLRKMLQPDREERYSSAAEVLTDLRAVQRRIESRDARRMIAIGIVAVIVAAAVSVVAAMLSITETWDERVLRVGHTAAARQVVFSPDGRQLLSGSEDGKVIVWDAVRRVIIATLPCSAYKVAFHPSGRWFATGGTNGDIVIWDTVSRKRLRVLPELDKEINALSFSGDGTRLVASSLGDGSIFWDTRTWKMLHRTGGCGSQGNFIFSRDPQQVICSGELRFIDLRRGEERTLDDVTPNWVALAPDQSALAAIGNQGEVWFYRVADGDLSRLQRIGTFHPHQDHGRAIAFSPDGQLVASAAEDIILWNANSREKITRFQAPSIVWSIAFSPDGRWLASSHADGNILLWDVAERALHASMNDHQRAVRSVAFSPDGRNVASAGEDRSVIVWNLDPVQKEIVFAAHATRVNAVAFAGARHVASGDMHGAVAVSDRTTGESRIIAPARIPNSNVYAVAATRDGSLIAASHGLYSASSENPITGFYWGHPVPKWPYGQIYDLEFFDDDRRVAAVTDGGWLLLWDIRLRRRFAQRRLPGAHLIAVDVSPDGSQIVTGEDEGPVRLWSVDPLREIAIIGRHRARVKSIAFSPDGKTVASAGDDKMVILWDVAKRKERQRVGSHASPVYGIAFAPDGRRLVSGEHDGSVRVYTRRRELWGVRLD